MSQDVELPQDWVIAAGMENFRPAEDTFNYLVDAKFPVTVIPSNVIQPPIRNSGVEGLNRERSISILKAFRNKVAIPALEADEGLDIAPYQLRIRDGFHRYHLAIRLGYKYLPVSIRPYFDISSC